MLAGLHVAFDSLPQRWVRHALFDSWQLLMPRERTSAPAVIIAIDEKSLARLGQWPWPRSLMAQLLDSLAAYRPLAVGVDIIFAEPDRQGPRNDALLADAMRRIPVVLGVAGMDQPSAKPAAKPGSPVLTHGNPFPYVTQYPSFLDSVHEIDRAAASRALLSTRADEDVIRTVPLIGAVRGVLFPSLGLETLRVGTGTANVIVNTGHDGVQSVAVGDVVVPTGPDGHVWVRFGPHDAGRYVSAADVLDRTVDPALIESKLALLGVTGIGLLDQQATPLGGRMPGVEIHAQLLENIFDGDLLRSPRWARWVEAGLMLLFGALLTFIVPESGPRRSALVMLGSVMMLVIASALLFRFAHVLLDAALPAISVNILFGVLIRSTLAETARQREQFRQELAAEREAAARMAGELEAARRVQMGMLPVAAQVFTGERRFEISAYMEPAKEVGGDLYEFFVLDRSRAFLMVGDVSGKGLPASIFMALSKASCKSHVMLRHGEVGAAFSAANIEMARDNPEQLFVTAAACVLNADAGTLTWSNAGHEPVYVLPATGGAYRLEGDSGPPLCMLDEFPYETNRHKMAPGERLVLISDGVTEAMNPAGELFGRRRLEGLLTSLPPAAGPEACTAAIRDAVRRYTGGAEMADDLTVLCLRWTGA